MGTGATGAGTAGIAEPPLEEVRCAKALPLSPRAAAGANGCVWRVSPMWSECNALRVQHLICPGLQQQGQSTARYPSPVTSRKGQL